MTQRQKKRRPTAPALDPMRMRTRWGKRRGWEIHRLSFSHGPYFRLTWRDGQCREATSIELALWRALPKEQRT